MANPFRAAVDLHRRPGASASGGSAFAGAAHSRMTTDWILASIQSADQEIKGDLRTLRARSRELVRNNDTAHRYVALVDEQMIGHEGIRLQAYVKRPDGMLDTGINDRIEDAWAEWCEPGNCTVDGRQSWVDVLSSYARSTPQDGEWLVRMLPFRGNRFGFALQIIDPDQLDHEYDRAPGNGRNEIRMGVEIDRWSRPVSYHIWDHHPSEYTARGRERIALPASQIAHLYETGRVGLTRGVPWFASALTKLRMIGGYEEAEIVAARIAAAKGGWFTVQPEAVPDPNAPNAEQQNQLSFEIEPGRFDRLPPGWDFKEWNPQHPTSAFSDFHKAMVRGVASGLDVSYVSLANDLEGVNFSSIRAGLLNERDAWRRKQWSLIRHFCMRVYREWLRWALTTGALQLPARNRERWYRHRWQPRGWAWVDPVKDMQAAAMAIRLGLDSRTRLAAERGLDFEEVVRDLAMEQRIADELGVQLSTDIARSAPASDNARKDDDEDDPPAKAMLEGIPERLRARIADSRILSGLAHTNGNGRH